VTGARRVGKTALIRAEFTPDRSHYFDLEDPRDRARLADPMLALEALGGMVAIDEAQRMPELFPILRVLIDGDRRGQPLPAPRERLARPGGSQRRVARRSDRHGRTGPSRARAADRGGPGTRVSALGGAGGEEGDSGIVLSLVRCESGRWGGRSMPCVTHD